jgi:cellulose synthase/poly-beta-1,6-N-acetylglucosamine synthase-like glycosyltransferase
MALMTLFIHITLWIIAIALAIPIMVLFVECSAALFPNRSKTPATAEPSPPVTILIPAHDEASGIQATLENLKSQLTAIDRIVVVADNCQDDTAEIARQTGVIVLERYDEERRGKGYALDYGLRWLDENYPIETVVMMDADCRVEAGSLQAIAHLSAAQHRPVQALYLMETPSKPSPKDAVSALAFLVKNWVRPLGLAQFGLPCLLTGTGMAFPRSILDNAQLASGNIVEDMQLGLDLAIAGTAPLFCPQARVTGILPQQEGAAKSQRTRWEHGHLKTLLTQVPPLLSAAIRQRRFDLAALALDLSVPPLSLLVMLWLATMAGTVCLGLWAAQWTVALFVGGLGALMLVAIVAAWVKFGRTQLPIQALLAIPFYVLWKIPVYFKFLVRPEKKWVRTERN